jgi:Cyclin-dependent kinase inhibitor 3 (CDKN3)
MQSSLPFLRSYWVVPGKLMGGFLPSAPHEAEAEHLLRALLGAGVTSVVNLMQGRETDHHGRPFLPYLPILQRLVPPGDIATARFPIPDLGVPSAAKMQRILDYIDTEMAAGRCVYVHCWGGKGRTGTVLGCWLARHGEKLPLQQLAALTAHARQHFPRIPETPTQRAFVEHWSPKN